MSYQVSLRRVAQKQLDRIVSKDYLVIAEAISNLIPQPRPPGVKKLVQSGLWRIRVGRYRVVYSIDDEERNVLIVRVARRTEDTYRGL